MTDEVNRLSILSTKKKEANGVTMSDINPPSESDCPLINIQIEKSDPEEIANSKQAEEPQSNNASNHQPRVEKLLNFSTLTELLKPSENLEVAKGKE